MNIASHAKKGTGLDDLFGGYTPQQLEESQRIQPESERNFSSLLATFQRIIKEEEHQWGWKIKADGINDVLSPSEINAILQASICLEDMPNYGFAMGKFITKLIQNSYDAGYNHFTVHLPAEIHELGTTWEIDRNAPLQGTENNPLQIQVYGKTSGEYFRNVAFCHLTIENNHQDYCGPFAISAQNSNITIKGSDVLKLGYLKNSSLRILGGSAYDFDVGSGMYGSSVEITGDIKRILKMSMGGSVNTEMPVGNIFKAHRRTTVRKLLDHIPQPNEIIYVHPDGTEELVRGFCQNTSLKWMTVGRVLSYFEKDTEKK